MTCYFLLSKNTSDDRRWQRLGAQLSRQQQLLNGAGSDDQSGGGAQRAGGSGAPHLFVDKIIDLEAKTSAQPREAAARAISSLTAFPSPAKARETGSVATGLKDQESTAEFDRGSRYSASSGDSTSGSVSHVSASFDDEECSESYESSCEQVASSELRAEGPAGALPQPYLQDSPAAFFATQLGCAGTQTREVLVSQAFEEELAEGRPVVFEVGEWVNLLVPASPRVAVFVSASHLPSSSGDPVDLAPLKPPSPHITCRNPRGPFKRHRCCATVNPPLVRPGQLAHLEGPLRQAGGRRRR